MDDVHNCHHASSRYKIPTVISFYTKGTPYEREIAHLRASCERFGLDYSIEGIESHGNWEINCAFKPFFIYQKIKALKRPIIWVDADGVFVREPEYLDVFEADLAVRMDETSSLLHPSTVISSTVYVNNTPSAEHIVRLWAGECQNQLTDPHRTEEFWDQIALRDVLFSGQKWDVRPLPLSYAKIFDHPGDLADGTAPVIQHYQASRRFKKIINKIP